MSGHEPKDLAAFAEALDRFGSDVESWPAVQRRIAESLLARGDPQAVEELDRAGRIEGLILQAMRAEPPVHLPARILSHVSARRSASWPVRWPPFLLYRNLVAAGAAAAIALVLGGVLLGAAQEASADDDSSDVVAVLDQVGFGADEEP